MLEIKSLVKRFGPVEAVSQVNIAVPDGAFLVLLGPSGCGKTTLLRMLAGLELPTSGQIAFDDAIVSDGDRQWAVEPAKRNSGLVFQSYALWPHMSVRGNVEWPLKVAGKVSEMDKAARDARVDDVLKMLSIHELAARYPNEISGGQQQRVAIARTIAPKPGVLLFDEPLSNLDAKLRVEMRTELMRLHRATGATSVYVTHDQIEAMTMATHVAVMNKGRVEQFGTPLELVENPQTDFVATFVGTPAANLLPVSAQGVQACGKTISFANVPPDAAQAMFKAERLGVALVETPFALPFELAETSSIAGRTMVTALGGRLRLTAVVEGNLPDVRAGQPVWITLPATADGWFNAAGRRIA
ncbi:MAG: ABC transporter ATP-binding protein [Phyllobacteriaceae bacterium]|nr:ABC transporter ATP-binding protein [Phyllobacteriaceae bacterium]